jgi:hypothetical protein
MLEMKRIKAALASDFSSAAMFTNALGEIRQVID